MLTKTVSLFVLIMALGFFAIAEEDRPPQLFFTSIPDLCAIDQRGELSFSIALSDDHGVEKLVVQINDFVESYTGQFDHHMTFTYSCDMLQGDFNVISITATDRSQQAASISHRFLHTLTSPNADIRPSNFE